MSSPSPDHGANSVLRWALVAGLLALGLAATVSEASAAAPICGGRRATIVSNAAKIVGAKAPDVIVAGPGANTIHGEGGNDLICAGGGSDTVFGGRGVDSVFGQGGDDTIAGERASDRLQGGAGADRLLGESGNDRLGGGAGGGDDLGGGPGDDVLSGGGGDADVLAGGPGNDDIDGGPGAHDIVSYSEVGRTLTVDLAAAKVRGAEDERLSGIEDVIGGSGDDELLGAAATPNRLDGGPGDDRLSAAGGDDEAFGGPGSDQCAGAFGAATSWGASAGNGGGTAVEIYASISGSSSLILSGGDGPDAATVSFLAGVYVVQGAAGGSRILAGDPGSSVCTPDPLANLVACRAPVSSILASMFGGDDSLAIDPSVPATVTGTLDGGTGADTISGGRGSDVIFAGDDHDPDSLEGGGGDDTIFAIDIFHPRQDSGAARLSGGSGNDLLVGGQPCDGDSFDGGPGGNDSASFARVRNVGVFVAATIGGAVLDPDAGGCDAGRIDSSVEKIEGTNGPDELSGDGAANTLLGRGGNDRLDGVGGSDTCSGGGGHDSAHSCESVDSIP